MSPPPVKVFSTGMLSLLPDPSPSSSAGPPVTFVKSG